MLAFATAPVNKNLGEGGAIAPFPQPKTNNHTTE